MWNYLCHITNICNRSHQLPKVKFHILYNIFYKILVTLFPLSSSSSLFPSLLSSTFCFFHKKLVRKERWGERNWDIKIFLKKILTFSKKATATTWGWSTYWSNNSEIRSNSSWAHFMGLFARVSHSIMLSWQYSWI